MTRYDTKAERRRRRALCEGLAPELLRLARYDNAEPPQKGTRPLWVTPRVLKSSAWFARKGTNARRAGITRSTYAEVANPRACLRFPGTRPDAAVTGAYRPEPETRDVMVPARRRRRRRKVTPVPVERIDVAPYPPRYHITRDDDQPDWWRFVRG